MDTAARNKTSARRGAGANTVADLRYQPGFGSELATEALPGALPQGQNSPQKVGYGLYAEQFSGRRPGISTGVRGCTACALRWRTVGFDFSMRDC